MCGHDNTCPAYARWAAANLQRISAISAPDDCEITPVEAKISADERARLSLFFKDYSAQLAQPKAEVKAPVEQLPPDAPRGERNQPRGKRSYGGLKFRRL